MAFLPINAISERQQKKEKENKTEMIFQSSTRFVRVIKLLKIYQVKSIWFNLVQFAKSGPICICFHIFLTVICHMSTVMGHRS